MKAYAGIGSRSTPADVCEIMAQVGKRLAWNGWTLRSGRAPGADQAFEVGAWAAANHPHRDLRLGALDQERNVQTLEVVQVDVPKPQIFLPWATFEMEAAVLNGFGEPLRTVPQRQAYEIAAKHHPRWLTLKRSHKDLHARNVHQILGPDVTHPTPSRFVLCWTEGARGEGGTGQAIRIALAYDVPVFDLEVAAHRDRVLAMLR